MMFDAAQIRKQFPFFKEHSSLAYLDNAATTQKPRVVIDAITSFYTRGNANIHRGLYEPATSTSRAYEQVRASVAQFIGGQNPKEIVFTTGSTGGINLVAHSFLRPRLEKGDEVLISAMEHHSNLLPWQEACHAAGAHLRVIPMNEKGELDLKAFRQLLGKRTKMLALVHVSNTLGTINPVGEIVEQAHKHGIPVLVDAAQSIATYPIDVSGWGVDFLTFSGHKIFGPTGVGVLYGKSSFLADMQALHFGGDMVRDVRWEQTTYADPPQRFEAGTTNIAGVLGLGAAIDFMKGMDRQSVISHLEELRDYATASISVIDGLKIIGQASSKTAILSFILPDIHPHDVATFLAAENIAVRAGHHCTQPIMDSWGIPGTTRASFGLYNTLEEVDRLVSCLTEIQRFFS